MYGKRCKRCNGVIDPDTMTCLMCGREFKMVQVVGERRRNLVVNASRANDHYKGWQGGARLK